jgi:CO/xanthine dehydrogenase FAD-binding subunit
VLSKEGKLTGLELVRCTSVFDDQGRFKPSFDPATRTTVEADQVLVAIGQGAELGFAGKALRTERGLIGADPLTQATRAPGVYAGGDAVSGVGTVIEAIAAGRRAARAIDHALRGRQEALPAERPSCDEAPIELNAAALLPSPRARPAGREVRARAIDLEDVATLDRRAAEAEAGRCVNCGCVAVHASDLGPALVALGAKIQTTRRTLPAEDFFAARLMSATVLEADELVTEIRIPAPPPGSRQGYLKFRIRKAIDFPIVGVASLLTLKGSKIAKARIALGAVAPVPRRAREVEEFLRGKPLTEETAELASTIAVRGVTPLSHNRFKVQVLKALIKRALLGSAGG